ncbi:MAG TPA: AraC family transcriptional regulator [Bryobacteraceae bacterium]|nr:AraC family transcriptional regulator [Bryobacteraceae bacterium]
MPSISVGRITPLPCQALLRVGETFIPTCAPSLGPHRHPYAQLHLVLKGTYVESSRGKDFDLGPGSALFRPAQELHTNRFVGTAVRGLLIDIEPSILSPLLPGLDLATPCYFPARTFDDLCSDFECESRQDASERYTALHALALTLAVRLSRHGRSLATAKPAWVEEAKVIICSRYSEDLRLGALSNEIGVAPSTLAAAFRTYMQQSVGEFLINVRLQHARTAILESDTPLSRVAVSCGFYDQAHLTRAFRRQYGITPARLRRRFA